MFSVRHVFPSTGEWGSVEVESLDEALLWYGCKIKARNTIPTLVTLYASDKIIEQTILGISQVGKASGFGPDTQRFESFIPNQNYGPVA